MTAPEDTVSALARRLDDAAQTRTDTPSLADEYTIDIDEAYRIQNELLERRTSRGESIVGIKLGFTSQAKMAQMGVSEVIVGQLTDAMCVSNGGEVDLRTFIHPKIEPEVAYRLSKDVDLDDPNVDIETCVDALAPAMEIIDSRYRDFRFTYTDVVADNTSGAGHREAGEAARKVPPRQGGRRFRLCLRDQFASTRQHVCRRRGRRDGDDGARHSGADACRHRKHRGNPRRSGWRTQ
jgi:2-keto-4-pentenoate hydratase